MRGWGHSRSRSLALDWHHWDPLAILLHSVDGHSPWLLSILIACLISFTQLNLSWPQVLSLEDSTSIPRRLRVLRLTRDLFVWCTSLSHLTVRLGVALACFLGVACCIARGIEGNCFTLTGLALLRGAALLSASNCRLLASLYLSVALRWFRLSLVAEGLLLLSQKSVQVCHLLRLLMLLLEDNLSLASRHCKLRFLFGWLDWIWSSCLLIYRPSCLRPTPMVLQHWFIHFLSFFERLLCLLLIHWGYLLLKIHRFC